MIVGAPVSIYPHTRQDAVQKLTLDLGSLTVQSFAAGSPDAVRGTVRGHDGLWGPSIQLSQCVTDCSCPNTQ